MTWPRWDIPAIEQISDSKQQEPRPHPRPATEALKFGSLIRETNPFFNSESRPGEFVNEHEKKVRQDIKTFLEIRVAPRSGTAEAMRPCAGPVQPYLLHMFPQPQVTEGLNLLTQLKSRP